MKKIFEFIVKNKNIPLALLISILFIGSVYRHPSRPYFFEPYVPEVFYFTFYFLILFVGLISGMLFKMFVKDYALISISSGILTLIYLIPIGSVIGISIWFSLYLQMVIAFITACELIKWAKRKKKGTYNN